MRIKQHSSTDHDLADVLLLIQTAFAYMAERINPPSSMHRLSVSTLAKQCQTGELWSMGEPIVACMALKQKTDALYLGKLAVANSHRKQGIGKHMIDLAEHRANYHAKAFLELETRIELVENHAYFEQHGFIKTGEGTHDGFKNPTYIVMRKAITDT